MLDSRSGLNQGFDTYNDEMTADTPSGTSWNFSELRAEDVNGKALQWLENHRHDPFFLFLHYFDPDQTYRLPQPFASRYPGDAYRGEIAYTDHCIGEVMAKPSSHLERH